MSDLRAQTHNFGAGPSPLPTSVLQEAQGALLNFAGTGVGICEVSHRGKEFAKVIKDTEAGIRSLLAIPTTHSILFTQGGGTTQFASVVLNLLAYHAQKPKPNTRPTSLTVLPPKMDYVVTGTWSQKASTEAHRLTELLTPHNPTAILNVVANTKASGYTNLPRREDYNFSPKGEAAFVYYCENETINGVQFPEGTEEEGSFPFDLIPEGTPLVADFSSSFLSRPIANINRYDVIYAGAQKNLSPAGLTIVIVRNQLLIDANDPRTPIPIPEILSYKTLADSGSMYNTPPVFPIYISALVVKLLEETGGLKGKREVNERKAKALYEALEKGVEKGVVELNVAKEARSWMNVVWKVAGGEEGEKRFLEGAERNGLRQLKGHRSIGGIRASLYNAVTEYSVAQLIDYINEFVAQESSK